MVLHQALIPKIKTAIQPVTEFIRSNPIISTAAIGTIFATAVTVVRKRRKKKKVTRRKTTRRKKRAKTTRRKKVTHRRPRHRGHKRVTFTTKTGKKVRFLVRGKKRSPRHARRRSGKKARRFIKGSPEAKRFMAKLRRMKR